MTFYLHQPAGIFLRSKDELKSVGEDLPVGTYSVSITPQSEFYLAKIDSFTRPKKLYGTVKAKATRILSTFESRSAATGLLLSGEAGSGKTMLSRELSIMGSEVGYSTIVVAQPFCGPTFNSFIQQIDVPAIVVFDEFEKVYDAEQQESMLTLLDGVFPTKKLFVLTCNNVYRINEHMLNRPGRLFYHLRYKGLEQDFVTEYCQDCLQDQSQIAGVQKVAGYFYTFNFDMLKALVEEMNRYQQTALEAVEMLNMLPNTSDDQVHQVEVLYHGAKLDMSRRDKVHCSPLSGETFEVYYIANLEDGDEDEDQPKSTRQKPQKKQQPSHGTCWRLNIANLVSVKGGVYVFSPEEGVTITLSREKEKQFSYHAF